MNFIDILLLLFAGTIGGFLSGMLGVGGGIVFVPVIQQVLINYSIKEDFVSYTLANSLALVFVVGVTGTVKQLKLKNTHLVSALITGVSAILTSVSITFVISKYNWFNPRIFNILFAVILILTVIRMLFSNKDIESVPEVLIVPPIKRFIPAGLFAGVVTAMSGLGGGIVMVPYFNKVLKLPIRFSTGLSLSVIPIIALPLLIFYSSKQPSQIVYSGFQTGYLMWPLILPIVIAAVLASQIGVSFAQKLNSQTIKWIFVIFVCLTLIKMAFFQ